MKSSTTSWQSTRTNLEHGSRNLEDRLRLARLRPNEFAELCFTDAAGQTLRQGQVHRDLQAFLTQQRHALIELPRDHGKSVQICLRILWELGHDPSLRVQIVCASDALAAARCRFLRDALARNAWLQQVFPNLRPARPWGQLHFTLARPANVIGPSVTALGIGTATTGSRADLLVCDDIVDVKALRSRADRERVKIFFHENLMNLLEPAGRFWGLFTPWHTDDLNAALKQNPAYALFRRAIGDNLEPIWPEKWPAERLEARRQEIGSVAFARGYRLVCVPDEAVPIRAAWVRFWTPGQLLPSLDWADPSSPSPPVGERAGVRGSYEQIILSVDPAVSQHSGADYTALVALGRTTTNEVHCLEALARRVPAPELIDLLDAADQRWRPDLILFESNAAFAGIRELLQRHARFGPKIKPVVQTKDKVSRVHAFSVPVENGSFRLKGVRGNHVDPAQQALFDEMTTFPLGEHDDLLDAAATGTAYLLDRPEPRIW